MENQLKCVLLLSLKELALRRVSVLLWSGSDILASIAKFDFFSFKENEKITKEWHETTEDKIRDKVSKLEIPELLKKRMIDILKPMSLDVRRWAESHKHYFSVDRNRKSPPDVTKLCWTAAGTIDNRKTAEKLLRCDSLYLVELSYKLACFYCLEDYIPHLWRKIPLDRKIFYYSYEVTEPLLLFCWPHILEGEISNLDYLLSTSDRNPFTLYQYIFEYSAKNGNRSATEYFFLKLPFEERNDSLMRSTHAVLTKIQNSDPFEYLHNFQKENISSVLCFLLSVMTPVQQMEIFQSRPLDILFSLLAWPWQDLFLENVGLIWTFIPPSNYGDLLRKMRNRYFNVTYCDFYLPKCCQELFIQSPLEFKKGFLDKEHESNYINFLRQLFNFNDSETLGVIFRNLDAASRVKLVFHHDILCCFAYWASMGRWRLVNVCIREAMLSKEDKELLKKSLMEYLKSEDRGEIECENQSLKRFFEFLDNPDLNTDEKKKAKKRRLENC